MRRMRNFASSMSSSTASRCEFFVHAQADVDPEKVIPLRTIGKGCFGKVILVRSEDELIAMKIIPKSIIENDCMMEKVSAELKIMKTIACSSAFLTCNRGAYQTDEVLLLAMNYASAGDMLFHLQLEGCFEESRVRVMMMQIVLGIQHLHQSGVVHRDLKLENILVTNEGRIQISDFGLSKCLTRSSPKDLLQEPMYCSTQTNEVYQATTSSCFPSKIFFKKPKPTIVCESAWSKTQTLCGTPAYRSPEMVRGEEYGMEVDYWALGCMAYECLTGWSAFRGKTLKILHCSILKDQPRLHGLRKPVSVAAKRFVMALLTKNSSKRLGCGIDGARKVRDHPFFFADRNSEYSNISWDHVLQLEIPPTVLLAQGGVVLNPEQANCFPEECINMNIVETIAPPPTAVSVDGFQRIPNSIIYDKFITAPPLPEPSSSTPAIDDSASLSAGDAAYQIAMLVT